MPTKLDKEKYGQSTNNNFSIKDTIGVPHPYCITPKHISYASDHYGGILGESAIEGAEKAGVRCGVKGCKLSLSGHKTALLVECKKDFQTDKEADKELKEYLLNINEQVEKDGYVGYAFIK